MTRKGAGCKRINQTETRKQWFCKGMISHQGTLWLLQGGTGVRSCWHPVDGGPGRG